MSDGKGGTASQTWAISMTNPSRPITGTWRSAWADPEVTFYVHAGAASDPHRVWLDGSRYETTNQLIQGNDLEIYQGGSRLYGSVTTLDRVTP